MSVSAVQMNEHRSPLSIVAGATILGGTAGYVSKYIIPLRKEEKGDINRYAIINSCRKDINAQKVSELKALNARTEAQDQFIKMIEYKNADIKEPLGGSVKKFFTELKEAAKSGLTEESLNKKLATFGENVQNAYKAATDSRATTGRENIGKSFETLKEGLSAMIKKGFNEGVLQTKLDEFNDSCIKSVVTNEHVFSLDNRKAIIKSLGGENSSAGIEFKAIIKEVNQSSSSMAKKVVHACQNIVKNKRYATPLVVAGAAVGFAAGFIHNVFSYNNTRA